MWRFRGQRRPDFAVTPGAGQESVWDYPRPPELEVLSAVVEIRTIPANHDSDAADGTLLAQCNQVLRVLETASPPTVYLPPQAIDGTQLQPRAQSSFCEWKGSASYWGLPERPGDPPVGWSYASPSSRFQALAGWFSFYPARVACYLDGERVRPQGGGFYGGWVTDAIVGPWKGEPGSSGW